MGFGDVFERIRDFFFGRENAERIREHNREIEEFGNPPEPRESPSPTPSESSETENQE